MFLVEVSPFCLFVEGFGVVEDLGLLGRFWVVWGQLMVEG